MSETIPEAFLAKLWALLTDSDPDAITPADLVLLCWRLPLATLPSSPSPLELLRVVELRALARAAMPLPKGSADGLRM